MQHQTRSILFTVDVEEFDTALRYGYDIPMSEQIAVSTRGLFLLAERFEVVDARTTLFTTANYALHEPRLIRRLAHKHEIASHGYHHWTFEPADLASSKAVLENLTGNPVVGFRMANMAKVDAGDVAAAGYVYNSSLHPTFLPGKYNNLRAPRTPFVENGVLQMPASVTPRLRIPLFWLSLKNFPFALYKRLCLQTLRHDGLLNLYVHPWEFTDLSEYSRIAPFVRRYSNERLLDRTENLLRFLGEHGDFQTMQKVACSLLSHQLVTQ
ncbi:polysaccharide deacetylase family protein [Nibrella viscosa]|uniref:Polysaccharide deacetylase family protein n=1 Tax=Nibrella viscosa TaxID=1084524 RepID=A0ABP8KRV1_9BACT